jgi:hypothetical protein
MNASNAAAVTQFMIANAHELMPATDWATADDGLTSPPALPALPAGFATQKPLPPAPGVRGSPAAQLSPLQPPSPRTASSRVLPPALVAAGAPQFGSVLSPRGLPAPPQPLPIGGPMLQSPAMQAKVSAELLQRISASPAAQ